MCLIRPRSAALALFALIGSTASLHAQKDLASCRPVLDAMTKQAKTPSHVFTTTEGLAGGSSNAEIIFVGGVTYINTRGRWVRSPVQRAAMDEQQAENLKTSTMYVCKHLRDESVDGTAAAVYESTTVNEGMKFHGTIWIAKSTGLPLRNDIETIAGEGEPPRRSSMKYQYTNVQAPAGVK